MKRCLKCKLDLTIDNYYLCKSRKDGLSCYCKKCSEYWGGKCKECKKDITRNSRSQLCSSCVKKGERSHFFNKKGEKSPNWKEVGLSYKHLHRKIKEIKVAPNACENCKEQKKLDLANRSGKYLNNISDWLWLCRKCHKKHDSFFGEAHPQSKLKEEDVRFIRKNYKNKTQCEFSKIYSVSASTISKIINRKVWKHI